MSLRASRGGDAFDLEMKMQKVSYVRLLYSTVEFNSSIGKTFAFHAPVIRGFESQVDHETWSLSSDLIWAFEDHPWLQGRKFRYHAAEHQGCNWIMQIIDNCTPELWRREALHRRENSIKLHDSFVMVSLERISPHLHYTYI